MERPKFESSYNQIEKEQKKVILELGVGARPLIRRRNFKPGEVIYTALDFNWSDLKDANSRQLLGGLMIRGSINKLPMHNESVDMVIASNLFSGGFRHDLHCDDALEEITRVLKTDGLLCKIESNTPGIRDFIFFHSFKIEKFIIPIFVLKSDRARIEKEVKDIIEKVRNESLEVFDAIRFKEFEENYTQEGPDKLMRVCNNFRNLILFISNSIIEVETENISVEEQQVLLEKFIQKQINQENEDKMFKKIIELSLERIMNDQYLDKFGGIIHSGIDIISATGNHARPYVVLFRKLIYET
jgi:ubiquinone/menaquinone biosynthesis C-methylase UbiE